MTVIRDNVARSIVVSTATCILPRHGRPRALILTILDVDATTSQLLPDLNSLARSTAFVPACLLGPRHSTRQLSGEACGLALNLNSQGHELCSSNMPACS